MKAEAELIALRSMCRAAAEELMEHWPAHCNEEGYGPAKRRLVVGPQTENNCEL